MGCDVEELLALLGQLQDCLSHQMGLFEELLPLLDREEELLQRFDVGEVERLVVEKDQVVRRARAVEDKRLALLRRVCFLIGYDARGDLPSLTSFLTVFASYVGNVKPLVDAPTAEALAARHASLSELSARYLDGFRRHAPRIQRNQAVLTKLARNFERSLTLLRNEASLQQGYDSTGRSRERVPSPKSTSSVRVKA